MREQHPLPDYPIRVNLCLETTMERIFLDIFSSLYVKKKSKHRRVYKNIYNLNNSNNNNNDNYYYYFNMNTSELLPKLIKRALPVPEDPLCTFLNQVTSESPNLWMTTTLTFVLIILFLFFIVLPVSIPTIYLLILKMEHKPTLLR